MTTTGPPEVFHEPVAPLRPARGRLTLVFLLVVGIGILIGRGLAAPGDDGTGGSLTGNAPEVVLIGFDGAEWRLSEHLVEDGRPVILNLWASWCIPCRQEIPALTAFASSHHEFAVVGVAVEDRPGPASAFAVELQPGYLVGMDGTGRLRDLYPSVGMPFTVVIDVQGVIRWSKVGGVTADDLERATAGIG
jgi:cytochrome c biogenesis protein CcmG, thiol:disulfide interchange protein DsbE